MPGLMNPKGEPQKAMSQQQAPVGGAPAAAGGDDQAAYNSLVGNAANVLYNPDVMPGILRAVQMAPNPVEGMAAAIANVLTRLEDSAAEAGQEFSPKVRAGASKEIAEMIAELAGPKGAGIHEYTQEELGNAFQMASANYGMLHGPEGRGKALMQKQEPMPQQGAM